MNKQEILKKFEEKFRCIQYGCDNHGNIKSIGSNGEPEQRQCQFCYEYLIPMSRFISDLIDEANNAKEKAIKIGFDTFEFRINCNTVISELYGWKNILEYSKEQVLQQLNKAG